jgi:spermidine synthase
LTIPRRTYFWSHFQPVIVEETKSEHNAYLAVAVARGRLQLLTANAIYSWDDLYDNFYTAFHRLSIGARAPRTALILGGGLGSIPFMLEKRFKVKDCVYTVVEYDEEVNYLANKYAYPRLSSQIDLITADAGIFMEVTEEKYDLICIDIFEDDLIPEDIDHHDFMELCRDALEPNGLLLFNRLYQEERDIKSSDRFYEVVWKKVFPEGTAIKTQGNLVLVGENTAK